MLAAFSTSAEMLIVARALLGIAGATLAPSTLSLIFNMFEDTEQRRVAIGVWIASYSAGAALGPLLGGVLLEFFWWGSVFLLGVPVMALLLLVGPRLLPESKDPDGGRLDVSSAALSLAAVLAVIYGFKQIAQDGFGWSAVLLIVLGLAIGAAFVRRQTRLADPLIDLGLFRIRAFSAALSTNLLGFFAAFGVFVFTAQYLQLVLGLSPLEAGLWTLPSSLGFVVGAMLVPVLASAIRPGYLIAGGLALAAIGVTALTLAGGVAIVVGASTLFSLGLSPVAAIATELIVGSAPPERAGAASGMSETSAELGGALGIAILGSIGTAVYRGQVGDALPAGVPPEAEDAARDTAGGAIAAGESLPSDLAARVLDAGRDAFTQALHASALTSAIILLGTAILAAALLRHVRRPAPETVTA